MELDKDILYLKGEKLSYSNFRHKKTSFKLVCLLAQGQNMVRKERLELSHLTILEPKSSASTNSATSA